MYQTGMSCVAPHYDYMHNPTPQVHLSNQEQLPKQEHEHKMIPAARRLTHTSATNGISRPPADYNPQIFLSPP